MRLTPAAKRGIRTFIQAFAASFCGQMTLQLTDVLPTLDVVIRIFASAVMAGIAGLVSFGQNAIEDRREVNPKWMLKD